MPQEWAAFLREFGLPLTMLVVVLAAWARGVFVTGKSAEARIAEIKKHYEDRIAAETKLSDERAAADEREKAYREERRVEERANRLLTEEALKNMVSAVRDQTELLKDIERNIRGQG